jgi:tRNA1Val (adenine37-N6)-methyltransferase
MDVTLDSICDIQLYQSKTGYRFSVDSLLLCNFVNLQRVSRIADLGAGSGIVGILLSKKYPAAQVTLFEIQDGLVRLAEKNVVMNHLQDRVQVIKCDLRKIAESSSAIPSYDLVVSNPPFRRVKSGRINREEERAVARHEITLKLHELVAAVSSALTAKGRFCMIYHPCRLSELIDTLRNSDIEPKRLRFVHSNMSAEAKMVLLEAVKSGRTGLKVEKPLYIYHEDGSYTKELEEIYGDSE